MRHNVSVFTPRPVLFLFCWLQPLSFHLIMYSSVVTWKHLFSEKWVLFQLSHRNCCSLASYLPSYQNSGWLMLWSGWLQWTRTSETHSNGQQWGALDSEIKVPSAENPEPCQRFTLLTPIMKPCLLCQLLGSQSFKFLPPWFIPPHST